MSAEGNRCVGTFGALYSAYIEREWLGQVIGRAVWGIDLRPMYRSMHVIAEATAGATIVDVPCGGGVALRALRPAQDVAYIAIDISDPMLERTRRRAKSRGLTQVTTVRGDMRVLPVSDDSVDIACCYSGLHMIPEPARAIHELARALRPGGRLVGTTFIANGTARQRCIFAAEERRGKAPPLFSAEQLQSWLASAGLRQVTVLGRGFAVFGAVNPKADPA